MKPQAVALPKDERGTYPSTADSVAKSNPTTDSATGSYDCLGRTSLKGKAMRIVSLESTVRGRLSESVVLKL